jgi:hypothetical protein
VECPDVDTHRGRVEHFVHVFEIMKEPYSVSEVMFIGPDASSCRGRSRREIGWPFPVRLIE